MERLLSILDTMERRDWFGDDGGRQFMDAFNLDGFELIYYEGALHRALVPGSIKGVHLPFYADWMAFWLQDRAWLDAEFGGREVWRDFYGGEDRDAMVAFYRDALRFADAIDAKYVVFHVSNVSLDETIHGRFRYSDREVVDAAAELANIVLRETLPDGRTFRFRFLMENLWWPGLNFRDPEVTARLLDQVDYERKGLLLDTGHLLCADPTLRRRDDAAPSIIRKLEAHRDLLPYIGAIHLHRSLSGAFALAKRAMPFSREGPYLERFARSYEHVLHIDRHEVWDLPGLDRILELADPDYLVYEFKYSNEAAMRRGLQRQNDFFGMSHH